MADYQLQKQNMILRNIDNAWIPMNPENKDYQEYLIWTENNTPDPIPDDPNIIPNQISDRQFFQQLSIIGIITEEEALASNAAVIPTPLLTLIDAMPEEQKFGAKMIISGATVFERNHPMTEYIGQAYGWTSEQIDNFFIEASLL